MATRGWDRLARDLGTADVPEIAGDARVGATLALVADVREGDIEIVYTKRREDMRTHPGQISFPGGRLDDGETVPEAALREAKEEVALDPTTVTLLGALPSFYVPPSRFWLQTVVGRWDDPHDLMAAEGEVAEIICVRLSELTDPARWRCVRLSAGGGSWAWRLDGGHLLWGATAVMTAALLERLVPGWHHGRAPTDLPPEQEVQPWLESRARGPQPPVVPRVPSIRAGTAPAPWDRPLTPARMDAAAGAVGRVGDQLARGLVVVLVGGGAKGRLGLAVAHHLEASGRRVQVVLDRPGEELAPEVREGLAGLRVDAFAGDVPRADLYIDALVGPGLRGPLRGAAKELLLALRRRAAPLLALALPTGLDPVEGLIGDALAARATVALGGPWPGALASGVEPFVGDLYVADDSGGIRRVIRHARPGWRE